MKKTLILALILIVIINILTLTSCVDDDKEEHIHEFSNEWSKIDEYHFHECLGKDCFEVADKEEHLWDEGKITTEATKEEMGEKIYTCTVCNAVKGEKLEFNGISKEKWNNIVDLASFDNVTFILDAIGLEGVDDEREIVKISGDKCLIDEEPVNDAGIHNIKELFIKTSLTIVKEFENFIYDKENDVYVANKTIIYDLDMSISENDDVIEIANVKITAENVKMELDDNLNIYKITCKMTQEFNDEEGPVKFVVDVTFTFTNYGTTVIE